jgi:hypothetical protein
VNRTSLPSLTPTAIEVSPDPATGWPRIGIALDDGRVVAVVLDPAHGRAVARRIDAITSGEVAKLAPSRRALWLDAAPDPTADTQRPSAIGGLR